MSFRFSLESLLRLRRSQQRQQEILVQRENERVNLLARELEAVRNEGAEFPSEIQPKGEIRGAELHFNHSRRRVLEQRFLHVQQLLHQAQERQAVLASELHSIWQETEVLGTLRRREQQSYSTEEARREQRRQDDLFLARKRKRQLLPS